jgi:hypothetical protein
MLRAPACASSSSCRYVESRACWRSRSRASNSATFACSASVNGRDGSSAASSGRSESASGGSRSVICRPAESCQRCAAECGSPTAALLPLSSGCRAAKRRSGAPVARRPAHRATCIGRFAGFRSAGRESPPLSSRRTEASARMDRLPASSATPHFMLPRAGSGSLGLMLTFVFTPSPLRSLIAPTVAWPPASTLSSALTRVSRRPRRYRMLTTKQARGRDDQISDGRTQIGAAMAVA